MMAPQNVQRAPVPLGWLHALLLIFVWGSSACADESALRIPPDSDLLLVTQFKTSHLAYVDPHVGVIAQVRVGRAPYSVVADAKYAYVATGEGVAVVDILEGLRIALIPYQASIEGIRWGEYRQGGMGIALSPDGKTVAVGVNLGSQNGQLELISTSSQTVLKSVAIGVRPFQVLFSREGDEVYSIDHDSYSVTAYNITSDTIRVFETAPLGYGSFAKPHYAAMNKQGDLLLPIQGRVLLKLNPRTGEQTQIPMTAQTHQHGVTLSCDDSTLYVIGTGPAGEAGKGASFSRINLGNGQGRNIALDQEHEQVVLSMDGKFAYLTGGNSFTEGWDGISVIDLERDDIQTIQVENQPLGVTLWRTGELSIEC